MTKDEQVNGPKVAAQILNKMKPAHKDKLVKAITAADPEIAAKIENNLFDFNDLIDITPQGMQLLIQEIEHQDLVVSLKTASDNVKDYILQNMSDRKRQMVNDDFAALSPTRLSDVEDAQRKILGILDELRAAGKILTRSSNDVWV